MANVQVSAVDIERIWHADYTVWADKTSIAGTDIYALLNNASTKEVMNVHQDTWQIEESEASQEKYKNQLTGNVYRMGAKEMGEVTVQFTIGKYDYATKADLLGGSVIYNKVTLYGSAANSPTLYGSSGSGHTVEVVINDGRILYKKPNSEEYSITKSGDYSEAVQICNAVGWQRARGIVEIKRILIGLTEDGQYVIFPQANFNTREANTDKAIGLAVTATAMEPDNEAISAEYWYDKSVVTAS